MDAKKTLLLAIFVLFALTGSRAYAEDGVSKYILGLDVGKDSWGYEVGGRFGQRYASFGVSIRDIGDEWPWGYNRFDHAPLTT